MQVKSWTGIFFWVFFVFLSGNGVIAQNDFFVCGDSKVLVVDYDKSEGTVPHIKWEWDAAKDTRLPEIYREQKFRTMVDSKLSPDGTRLLVASSSGGGGVALLSYPEKELLFYTEVGNAHSIEFLPGGLIAVAGSTSPKGNKVAIFDLSRPDRPVAEDSLYSGHGVVWHARKKLLYALGYDVLRAYEVKRGGPNGVKLVKKKEWKIPGKSGHDLLLVPGGRELYLTEHTDAWVFDLKTEKFGKISDFPTKENIKSIGRNKSGQLIYTEPEESWWTFSVRFINPERRFAFPEMKVYKARWVGR